MITATGEYRIDVNRVGKTIDMLIRGAFTPDQAKSFHSDYQTKTGSVDAANYTLKVDCTDMNVITKEMIPALEISFNMYKESGFNKVEFLCKKSPVVKMQLKRVANTVGLANAEVLEV